MRCAAVLLCCLLPVPAGLAAGAGELVPGAGIETVQRHCSVCHSLRLVAQNRADRQGWLEMIRWMQSSQGLWPLGPDEPVILDYLATHYPPLRSGRRQPLRVTFD